VPTTQAKFIEPMLLLPAETLPVQGRPPRGVNASLFRYVRSVHFFFEGIAFGFFNLRVVWVNVRFGLPVGPLWLCELFTRRWHF
jgi:hypothetical protein